MHQTVDIVIVNFNSTNFLINCLHSVERSLNGRPAGIYVQDNASTDGVDRIRREFPSVTLTRNSDNLGFAKAVNQGLRKSSADYVVLLNPDTYVIDDFFDICLDFMDQNPDVGIMGSRILDGDGRLQNSARSFPTPLTAFFGRSSFISRWFPNNPITSRNLLSLKSDGKSPMTVDWVSGACMVIRKKAVDQVGNMDERFFMYWEDADWCRRMGEAGWRVVYYPKPSVYHSVGGSSEKNAYRALVAFHKSVYLLFEKYLYPSLPFLKPMVYGGLIIRLLIVLMTHFMRRAVVQPLPETAAPKDIPVVRKKKNIRVLRIISRMNIGGPAIHVHLLTNGLDKTWFESMLVTGKISPKEGDMSYLFGKGDKPPVIIPELQREINVHNDLRAFMRLFRILPRYRPDIIHTHTAKAGSSARFAAVLYNLIGRHRVLMVHTFHGHIFEGYFSRLNSELFINIERLLAKASSAIIAISKTQKQDLVEKFRIAPDEKIRIIELGFDLRPFFLCKSMEGTLRRQFGISETTLLIGIVGRLVPIKNQHMFFNAARQFIDRNPDIRVKFMVVGDGELRQALEDLREDLGLAEHIEFCGWIQDVCHVYADLDILALTSLNEGTPVSIIESMAAGIPVISTHAGGVQDLLGSPNDNMQPNGFVVCERGILCGKEDPKGFADGLTYMARADASETRDRIERARSFVEQRFNHRRLIRDIENLYVKLVDEKPGTTSHHS